MLLTSLAFAVAVRTARAQRGAGAGAPRRRRARARRHAVHRQDRHAHRGQARGRGRRACLTGDDDDAASMTRSRRIAAADPAPERHDARDRANASTRLPTGGRRRGAVLLAPASGAAPRSTARGVAARSARRPARVRSVGDDDGARSRAALADEGQRVVLAGVGRPRSTGDELPAALEPVGARGPGRSVRGPTPPTRCGTSREQGVTVKVISGDDPRTVGAIAGGSGLPAPTNRSTRATLPDGRRRTRRRCSSRTRCSGASRRNRSGHGAGLQAHGHTVA